jgi:hypothetical protein
VGVGHYDSSKPGRNEGRNGVTNPNANVSGSASVSEYDEDDEVEKAEKKCMDQGKWKARHGEDVGHG